MASSNDVRLRLELRSSAQRPVHVCDVPSGQNSSAIRKCDLLDRCFLRLSGLRLGVASLNLLDPVSPMPSQLRQFHVLRKVEYQPIAHIADVSAGLLRDEPNGHQAAEFFTQGTTALVRFRSPNKQVVDMGNLLVTE